MSENEMKYKTAPKRTIESVKAPEVIHCPTEDDFNAILMLLYAQGLGKAIAFSDYYDFESETVLLFTGLNAVGYVTNVEDSYNKGKVILPASDFLPANSTTAPAYDVSILAGPPKTTPAGKEGYTITPLQYLKMVSDFAAVYIATNPNRGVVDTSEIACKMVKAMLKETGFTVSHSAPTVAHDMD